MTTQTVSYGDQAYWIGDPCYVLKEVWSEVCDLPIDEQEGEFELADGRRIVLFRTTAGSPSGTPSGEGSGMLGAIRVTDIWGDANLEGGKVHVVGYELDDTTCFKVGSVIMFGEIGVEIA